MIGAGCGKVGCDRTGRAKVGCDRTGRGKVGLIGRAVVR